MSDIGNVEIKMYDDCIGTLGEVRYVLDLKSNLLSIGILHKLGYSIKVHSSEIRS